MVPDFGPSARAVLRTACREAVALRHDYAGTDHLLLGLLDPKAGLDAQVLSLLQLDRGIVRGAILDYLGKGKKKHRRGDVVPYTSTVVRILDDARAQAFYRTRPSVTSVHILLGLLRQHPCEGTIALTRAFVDLRQVKIRLLRLIGPGSPSDQAKVFITDLVRSELPERPRSDRELVRMLEHRAITISPGTVAAYRKQLGIPLARYRRQRAPAQLGPTGSPVFYPIDKWGRP